MRIPSAVNLRVPGQRESSQGESGAKARLKSVVDAQQVNIPALFLTLKRGRFMKFPASYGYDVGGISVRGRQIHHARIRSEIQMSSQVRRQRRARGKDMEPRKAAKIM